MKNLLYKEFKLVMHPTNLIFLALAAMMLIPSYPLMVSFFYITLGLFFSFLGARENHDIPYSLALPVKKRDLVSARMGFAIILELVMFVLCAAMILVRNALSIGPNQAGMDANTAMLGFSFLLMGGFNYYFFTRYFRKPEHVGKIFVFSAVYFFIIMLLIEAATFFIPFIKRMDTPDPSDMGAKLIVLSAGILSFALLTLLARKKAIHSFEMLDF